MGWEGKGGVSCRIITIFIYNIYSIYIFTILHGGRFERCRFVALYLVVFIMVSVSTSIFLCFFCACLLCLFGGGPGGPYLHLVSAVRPSKISSNSIDLIPIFLFIWYIIEILFWS